MAVLWGACAGVYDCNAIGLLFIVACDACWSRGNLDGGNNGMAGERTCAGREGAPVLLQQLHLVCMNTL